MKCSLHVAHKCLHALTYLHIPLVQLLHLLLMMCLGLLELLCIVLEFRTQCMHTIRSQMQRTYYQLSNNSPSCQQEGNHHPPVASADSALLQVIGCIHSATKINKLISNQSVQNYNEKLKKIQDSYICGLRTLVASLKMNFSISGTL